MHKFCVHIFYKTSTYAPNNTTVCPSVGLSVCPFATFFSPRNNSVYLSYNSRSEQNYERRGVGFLMKAVRFLCGTK